MDRRRLADFMKELPARSEGLDAAQVKAGVVVVVSGSAGAGGGLLVAPLTWLSQTCPVSGAVAIRIASVQEAALTCER